MDKRRQPENPEHTPLLSVITVVRNGADTINRALESVITQKTSSIEYLVLDGASTDKTVEHIENYASDIDYWHSEPDTGIAAAFNTGLQLARGRYVSFLNADDWYAPGALASVQESLREDPAIEWLCGSISYCDAHSDFQRVEQAEPENLPKYMSVYHPSMIVAAAAYRRVGPYDEALRYAMDSDWVHRAVRAGITPKTVPTIIANMTLGGTSNRNLGAALAEYRASVISNGLCSRSKANYYFVRQWLVHSALKLPSIRALFSRDLQ